MTRRAATLAELSAAIAIAAVVLGGTYEVLVRLHRLAGANPIQGARAEMACDRLRRDCAAGGARLVDGGLAIGSSGPVWCLRDGQLLRNGRPMATAASFTVVMQDRRLLVTLVPTGLPARRIEVAP